MSQEKKSPYSSALAGICFTIVVAWALISVLELTGTLTSATRIKAHVRTINANLRPIKHDLDFIAYAGKVARLTVQINAAAAPLTHQANTILVTARSIDSKVTPILSKVLKINGVVHEINSNALAINKNVVAIHSNVGAIGSSVSSITNSVASINNSVNSIHADVNTILGAVGPIGTTGSSITPDLTRVNNDFAGILTDVKSIQPHLAVISGKVNTINNSVIGIHSDFDGILANVGTANGTDTVVGHANSIDCSSLIDVLGKTQDCNGYNP